MRSSLPLGHHKINLIRVNLSLMAPPWTSLVFGCLWYLSQCPASRLTVPRTIWTVGLNLDRPKLVLQNPPWQPF
jgi:hypothetical protein